MMKNMSILIFPRSPSGFTDIKIAYVFHDPVQDKYEFQSLSMQITQLTAISFVTEVLEQPG